MRPRNAGLRAVAWGCAGLILLSGCASQATANSAYRTEFERAIASTNSTFQKEILADHQVTDAEYDAARQRFRECMKAAGITVQMHTEGGYSAREYRTDEELRSDMTCNQDSMTEVDSLYWSTRNNPDNRSYFSRVLECLQNSGVADETMTETDVEVILNEAASLSDEERVGYTLPSGMPVDDPIVVGCYILR